MDAPFVVWMLPVKDCPELNPAELKLVQVAATAAPPAEIVTPAFLWTLPDKVVPPEVILQTVPTLVLAVPEF